MNHKKTLSSHIAKTVPVFYFLPKRVGGFGWGKAFSCPRRHAAEFDISPELRSSAIPSWLAIKAERDALGFYLVLVIG
jgi:hypothetical protein